MAELEAAQQHLSKALQRLQTALERRSVGAGGRSFRHDEDVRAQAGAQHDELARHVGVLRSECDRLSAVLSEAQRDNENLRRVSMQVAKGLDSSIAEIDRLLEG